MECLFITPNILRPFEGFAKTRAKVDAFIREKQSMICERGLSVFLLVAFVQTFSWVPKEDVSCFIRIKFEF